MYVTHSMIELGLIKTQQQKESPGGFVDWANIERPSCFYIPQWTNFSELRNNELV